MSTYKWDLRWLEVSVEEIRLDIVIKVKCGHSFIIQRELYSFTKMEESGSFSLLHEITETENMREERN